MGFNDFLMKIFGNKAEKDMKELRPIVSKINAEWEKLKNLDIDSLREVSAEMKAEIRAYIKAETDEIAEYKRRVDEENPTIEEREEIYNEIDKIEKVIDDKVEQVLTKLLPKAFAVVKETARRFKENKDIVVKATQMDRDLSVEHDFVDIDGDNAIWHNEWTAGGNKTIWEMVHYDVQLIGGTVLHQGKIAEMATGEGKTLVATLPVFLNALSGRGVHVVTVNDYLAKRDSEWMGPLYMFHGLSVDCIDKHQPNSDSRKKAYMCDITFGTNNEFGFDYLRDNMAIRPEDLVQRKLNYAIVDEVDSVLIDDARTPLIISGPVAKRSGDELFVEYRPRVERLVKMQREFVQKIFNEAKVLLASDDSKKRQEGGVLLLRAHKGLPKYTPLIKFLSEQGNKAILIKTENEYMAENNRRMPEITDPLFFVIDEKQNSVELTDKGHDTITASGEDPEFFILPDIGDKLADLEHSDLSEEERLAKKDELVQQYAVKSERVHTINQLLKAYAMFDKDVEYVVMDNQVKIVDEQTGRIMEGRRYSDGLHQAIEAKEGVKVEAATQTFATITLQNYFRMYHKLAGMTGTAETEAGEFWDIYKLDVVVIPTNRPILRNDNNDLVYKTKREKYNAVIAEIERLLAEGRPVLVGTTSVEVSELLSKMLTIRHIPHQVLNAKLHHREADIVAEAGKKGTVTIATNMAGRGTDIKLSPEVKEAGGLAIIGTERHDSRRVDRQLRGRAGRQGDPGSSQFFVSLEDNLMRLFSSERIIKVMDTLGHEDGDVIQHSMITKSIERAQKKVEENHYGVRKHLLEYDDVMNSQRTVIYKQRRSALLGERIGVAIANNTYDLCSVFVEQYRKSGDAEQFRQDVMRYMSVDFDLESDNFKNLKASDQVDTLYKAVRDAYDRKMAMVTKLVFPVIKDVYENKSDIYKNIVIPFTDGVKGYNINVNLEKAYKSNGEALIRALEKSIMLVYIDDSWREHLREMDDLKQSVRNAHYEQKDPLVIYKYESYDLFRNMIDEINKKVISTLMKVQIPVPDPDRVREAEQRKTDMSRMSASRPGEEQADAGQQAAIAAGQNVSRQPRKVEPVHVAPKVGRNEPCPCGSGKKYKNCHGKNA
ncbi:MAG: preprotein translocase subunit SecA [Marinifilaceae bacterium]|nr:preprotein translocase subunit SecA [Marinifilaceae bacterium]